MVNRRTLTLPWTANGQPVATIVVAPERQPDRTTITVDVQAFLLADEDSYTPEYKPDNGVFTVADTSTGNRNLTLGRH